VNESAPIEALCYEFFREFARCEYCLKAVGLRKLNGRDPTADWGAFAGQVQAVFDAPPSNEVANAIQYYLTAPPMKQVVNNGVLDWALSVPDHANQAELVLRLICRVRNNLFHGGKFNEHWFEPQRSEDLIRAGLCLLRAVVSAHPQVRNAYENRADKFRPLS
jgi:hypothetical protein